MAKQLNIKLAFQERFEHLPSLVIKSPGRINLIGEHTDYNKGFVLPTAINKYIYFAISPVLSGRTCEVHALDFNERYTFDIDKIEKQAPGWQNYILGVVAELKKLGLSLGAFNVAFGGDIPQGAGMSSSAALECGLAFALNELYELGLSRKELAKCAQMAEHNYAGVKCGIMDQFANLMGKEMAAIKLDCKTLGYHHFPVDLDNYKIVLCNTNVSHNLASSEYNVRRQQCEEGVGIMAKIDPAVQSLRDATPALLDKVKGDMDPVVYRRCRYVIEENDRVEAMCDALNHKDFERIGQILYQAHEGMKNEYEVSCPELDFLVEFTKDKPYVLGARLMGGGFGGCTINVVLSEKIEEFVTEATRAYKEEFDKEMTYYVTIASEGTSVIESYELSPV